MSKPSPGPWRREGDLIESDEYEIACLIDFGVFDSGNAMRNANGNLIAAAPDLLEALEAFLASYLRGANSGDWGSWNPEEEEEVIAVRAAIAKARGK